MSADDLMWVVIDLNSHMVDFQAGGRGDPGAAAVLAGDEQVEGGAVSGGAGGGAGGDAERGVPAVHGAAVPADRAVSEQFAFPGRWWGMGRWGEGGSEGQGCGSAAGKSCGV